MGVFALNKNRTNASVLAIYKIKQCDRLDVWCVVVIVPCKANACISKQV